MPEGASRFNTEHHRISQGSIKQVDFEVRFCFGLREPVFTLGDEIDEIGKIGATFEDDVGRFGEISYFLFKK